MIYFDNAATTYDKPKKMIDAVVTAMNNSGNAGRGVHSASMSASGTVFDCRVKLSKFFGSNDADTVVFTNNSTESLNIAIKGILKSGDHVITTNLEHNAVLRPLYEMVEKGVFLDIVKCDEFGNIDIHDIEKMIKKNTKMIVTTHGSNVIGNIIDIKKIGELAKNNNIVYVVDASQTAGIFDINVNDMNIDVLCFTGHKGLLGPQGTGGMIIKDKIDIRVLKSGGTGIKTFDKIMPKELPTHLEAGTLNSHGIAGLSASIDYINELGLEKIRDKEYSLMKYLYDNVKNINGVKIYGDFSTKERCAIVSLNIADYDSGKISDYIYENYQIATRPKGHCAPLVHEFFGTKEQGMVRFSFCYENTFDEVDVAIKAIKEICE